jgi:hypothetical protein
MTQKKSSTIFSFFPRHLTADQSKDTGMAMTLLALIAYAVTDLRFFMILAIALLVLTMGVPFIFRPIAVIWFGLSTLLGSAVSKILLTIIFFLVITPIGILKRICGSEPLQLNKWKKNLSSVFTDRNHSFNADDLKRPF